MTAKKLYLRRLRSVVINVVWLLFDSIFVCSCVGCCIAYVSLLFGDWVGRVYLFLCILYLSTNIFRGRLQSWLCQVHAKMDTF